MKILIADDSALLRGIIREVLSTQDELEIAGEATNGKKALEKTIELRPDLIIMDVNMPVMDGIEATRLIMEQAPTPVLVFTSEVDAEKGFEAMESGAIEIVKKPPIDKLNDKAFLKLFVDKIRTLARNKPAPPKESERRTIVSEIKRRSFSLVVIGASTGGPIVVRDILRVLPGKFPLRRGDCAAHGIRVRRRVRGVA